MLLKENANTRINSDWQFRCAPWRQVSLVVIGRKWNISKESIQLIKIKRLNDEPWAELQQRVKRSETSC